MFHENRKGRVFPALPLRGGHRLLITHFLSKMKAVMINSNVLQANVIILTRKMWKRSETDTPKPRSAYQTKRENNFGATANKSKSLNANTSKLKVKLFGALILQLE